MGRCGEARTFVSTLAMDAMARQHALVIRARYPSRGARRGVTSITGFTLGRWRGVLSLSVACKMMFDVLGTHAHLGRTPARVPRRLLTSRHVAACRRARHGAHLPRPAHRMRRARLPRPAARKRGILPSRLGLDSNTRACHASSARRAVKIAFGSRWPTLHWQVFGRPARPAVSVGRPSRGRRRARVSPVRPSRVRAVQRARSRARRPLSLAARAVGRAHVSRKTIRRSFRKFPKNLRKYLECEGG